MVDYRVDKSHYSFSYQELREDYLRFKAMTDAAFVANLVKILHFACFVCFLKDIPTEAILSDKGVIHEFVHILNQETQIDALNNLAEIREKFNKICELA